MLKLKKNCVLLLGIFLFSSCGTIGNLPKKPKIEICAHDNANQVAECFDNQNQEYRSIPIEETDRFIMFSSEDWGFVLLYIDRIERRFRGKKLGIELKKIIETSKLHNTGNSKSNAYIY